MNNPLNRRMFRQVGMSKQPIGILASSPELMTTAQKAMMNNKPIKAQNAVSVNTQKMNAINSPLVNYFRNNPPLQTIKNFATDTADKFMINNQIIADMINKGLLIGSPEGKKDNTPTIMGSTLPEVKEAGEKFNKSLQIKKDDSDFIKSIKKSVTSTGDTFVDITKKVDKQLDFFRSPKEKEIAKDNRLSGLQKQQNLKANVNERFNFTDQFAGPQRLDAPKKGEERGLVDPNVLSPADPRFPESFPEAKPSQVLGLSIIDKIKEGSKTPKGISTNDADKALGIQDLSFKERVKARRDIISAALGRDVAEKDVRTDLSYNLMMTGLLVAAGQSPDALTNIANGLAAGLAGYGKAKGEEAQAKRKEDIAVGLAAVEQTFKETEAEKTRDKKPEAIRTLEFYNKNPDLLQIALQLKQKGKTRKEIAAAIAARAAGGNNLIPPDPKFLSSLVDFAVSGGQNISSGNATSSIPNSIKINFDTDQKADDMIGTKFNRFGAQYEIGKDGIATLVTGG